MLQPVQINLRVDKLPDVKAALEDFSCAFLKSHLSVLLPTESLDVEQGLHEGHLEPCRALRISVVERGDVRTVDFGVS